MDTTKKTRYNIYDFIVWYKKEYNGNSPSFAEMAEAVELKSKSPVFGHIRALIDEGLLYTHEDIEPLTARCLMVTGSKWVMGDD